MLNTSLEVPNTEWGSPVNVRTSSYGTLVQSVEHSADNRKIQVQVLEVLFNGLTDVDYRKFES